MDDLTDYRNIARNARKIMFSALEKAADCGIKPQSTLPLSEVRKYSEDIQLAYAGRFCMPDGARYIGVDIFFGSRFPGILHDDQHEQAKSHLQQFQRHPEGNISDIQNRISGLGFVSWLHLQHQDSRVGITAGVDVGTCIVNDDHGAGPYRALFRHDITMVLESIRLQGLGNPIGIEPTKAEKTIGDGYEMSMQVYRSDGERRLPLPRIVVEPWHKLPKAQEDLAAAINAYASRLIGPNSCRRTDDMIKYMGQF